MLKRILDKIFKRCSRCGKKIVGQCLVNKNRTMSCRECYPHPIESLIKYGEILTDKEIIEKDNNKD